MNKIFRKVCLDMDGVMCDYMSASASLFRKQQEYNSYLLDPYYPVDCESIYGITRDEYVDGVNSAGPEFWENMEPLPWAVELFKAAKTHAEGITFLTNPGSFEHSRKGKIAWLERYGFIGKGVDIIFSKEKHLHAGPRDVLVDDHIPNINQWNNSRGIGLLVSRPWTAGMGYTEQSIINALKDPKSETGLPTFDHFLFADS